MFLITGGGTGGHLAIAKALAEQIVKRGQKAIFVGSNYGQDRAWFEGSRLFVECYFLELTGVVNKKGLSKINALARQLKAALFVRRILKKHKIKCAISVGGFSAGGASIASILCGIPLFIHEQNAIKGKLNEILTPFAKAVFGSFASDSKNFIHTSYPVRDEFFAHARIREKVCNLLFLGGSQGAKTINDLALKLAPSLTSRGIHIIHQCGERDFERVQSEYLKLDLLRDIELFAFDSKLVERMQKADLCVARSGASSLWEMSANGLIGVFIPYPHAAKDHQYYNAKAFSDEGLGLTRRESELEPEDILNFIDSMQDGILSAKSSQVMDKIKPNGAEEILSIIDSMKS